MKERRHIWGMLEAHQSDENGSFVFGQRPWDRTRMFDVDARITRSEFWANLAFSIVVLFVTSVVVQLLVYFGAWAWISNTVAIVGSLLALLVQLNALANRAHDMGRSGAWALLWFGPILGVVLAIVLGSVPGQPGNSEWGPPVVKVR
jgi:uncharacterized membrane protein YhaH (DUF805 family)